jgi:DNA-binding GntR family transcriptional regulator
VDTKLSLPKVPEGRVLGDWVASTLRKAIVEGYIGPGERIDRHLVAEELRVSGTPIREALKALESEGFVEILPHQGAYVTTLTPQDVQEIYEVRALIEPEVVRQVTPVIPDEVLEKVEKSLEEVEEQADYVKSVIAFHDTVAGFVENMLLREIVDAVDRRAIRVRRYAQLRLRLHDTESHAEHCAVVRAMRQRDADRAAELMMIHIENSAQRMRELSSAVEA